VLRALITAAYFAGTLFSMVGFYRPRSLGWAGLFTGVGWGLLTVYLIHLGQMSREVPVTTFATWLVVLVWVIMCVAGLALWVWHGRYRALAGFMLPVGAVFWLVDLVLMHQSATNQPLSGWLPIHIATATMAVLALLLAAMLALMYTEKERELRRKSVEVFYYRLPALSEMDQWSARLAAVGLGLWLVAMVAGALSAKGLARPPMGLVGMGWSVFTAFMYGLYFVMRLGFGWRGRRAAVMLMVLFLLVVVNLFTLHLRWLEPSRYNF